MNITPVDNVSKILLDEIKILIDQAKVRAVAMINHELVLLNWTIGKRIKTEIIKNERADYGDSIVATLSRQLG